MKVYVCYRYTRWHPQDGYRDGYFEMEVAHIVTNKKQSEKLFRDGDADYIEVRQVK